MITTACRCRGRLAPLLTLLTTAATPVGRLAPLLALVTTTAATPVDYAADHVVFAHLRTGEGNRAFRDAFRETTAADAVPGLAL